MSKLNTIIVHPVTNVILLPLIIYHTIRSFITYYKEVHILDDVINGHDRFTEFLIDSGFATSLYWRKIFVHIPKTQVRGDEFVETTKRSIISAMSNLLEDSDLIGIAVVKIHEKLVHKWFGLRRASALVYEISLEPSTLSIVAMNLRDLSISVIVHCLILTILYII